MVSFTSSYQDDNEDIDDAVAAAYQPSTHVTSICPDSFIQFDQMLDDQSVQKIDTRLIS